MIWLIILFILFILLAEYTVLNTRNKKDEHWTNYKPIVNKGRCSQNIARVIPMFQKALDPMKPSNPHFNWYEYFDSSTFKQQPVNIAFRNL